MHPLDESAGSIGIVFASQVQTADVPDTTQVSNGPGQAVSGLSHGPGTEKGSS